MLSFSFEVRMRQGRVTLPCKSLRGVRAPNRLRLGRQDKESLQAPFTPSRCELGCPPISKGPPALPGAQGRFFAPSLSPVPHADAPAIAATFPDITAGVLPESNCLLHLTFYGSVNIRGASSLTVTDKATPAASYAPYFDSLTRALNQSFPVGETPGLLLSLPPPPYNWQYMPSRSVSSPKMKRNSSHIDGRQSSTTKGPRLAQPGTLTRAEILGAPSRPLQWLSPATPSMLRP